jgi:hypothetical protein
LVKKRQNTRPFPQKMIGKNSQAGESPGKKYTLKQRKRKRNLQQKERAGLGGNSTAHDNSIG